MNFVNQWIAICESQGEDTSLKQVEAQPVDQAQTPTPAEEQPQEQHTVEEPENAQQTQESEKGPVHFALAANIGNGLFKKDDHVFICHIGSTDSEGRITSTNRLTENDGDKMYWNSTNEPEFEFGGYDPNTDNDYDWIKNFSDLGSNAKILDTVKNHYGPRFRSFSIQEYYPQEKTDTFVDHIDSSMLKGLTPYCR